MSHKITVQAPIALEKPFVHPDNRTDSYQWLAEASSEAVLSHLTAENHYTATIMADTEVEQERLYEELVSRIQERDDTVPWQVDNNAYYFRYEKDKEYSIFCRHAPYTNTDMDVLLDENLLAAKEDYCDVNVLELSPDQRLLAYAVDLTGDEQYSLYVKNIETGELLADYIRDIGPSVAFAMDNKTLFYTKRDAAHRPYQIYRHTLGADPNQDVLVYEENDAHFAVDIYRSKSNRYLVINIVSHITTEMHYVDAHTPTAPFTPLLTRNNGVEYDFVDIDDYFYIRTNENALNFKLVKVLASAPDMATAEVVIPGRDEIKIEEIEPFHQHLVITERHQGLTQFQVIHLTDNTSHYIQFDEAVFTASGTDNADVNHPYFRFHYASLTTPDSIYDYHLTTGERILRKQEAVLGDYNPQDYHAERIFAPSADGTLIPISLVYKKGLIKDGTAPLYLYGYGAYGMSTDVWFSHNRLSLLNRGFVFAIAHVRGGSDLGEAWYKAGKLLHKKNSFTDFVAAAECLIQKHYTSANRLVAYGASAGGLLVGAAMNLAPHLFHTIIAEVPFVDTLTTMLNPDLPLTISEYEEWGNPGEPIFYAAMKEYSPYDNIRKVPYPHVLMTTSLHDTHVSYAEAAKFVAKLRAYKTNDHVALLKINLHAGHGGTQGRYEILREIAFQYAFIFKTLELA
jgi:oligopeptidase B